jgi:hypothetical protein
VPAYIAHQIEAWQRLLGLDRIYTDAEVEAWYFAGTGGVDSGMIPQDALTTWLQTGFPAPPGTAPGADQDQLLAWVLADATDLLLVQTALNLFDGGAGLLGLPHDAAVQWENGQEWEVTTGPGSVLGSWGSHFALVSSYDADGVTFETWGGTQTASWAWWDAYCQGLYIGVGNDWAGDPLVDLPTLEGDMRQLAGPPSPAPTTPAGTVLGVDVSSWQGDAINWAKAKAAGVRVAWVQASEGTTYRNPHFAQQVAGAGAAGILAGAYHMSHPAQNSPLAEYDYFKATVGATKLDLAPMVDDETMGGIGFAANRNWHLTFLGLCGAGALHYSNVYYLENMGPLGRQWTARPGADKLSPGDFAVQFSLGSSFPGFSGAVDLDAFNPAILSVDPPAPKPKPPAPKETKMLVIFDAKVVAGPSTGVVASFLSVDLMRFRWLKTPQQVTDVLALAAASGTPITHHTPGKAVGDVGAFGNPDDATSAEMLGLPFP